MTERVKRISGDRVYGNPGMCRLTAGDVEHYSNLADKRKDGLGKHIPGLRKIDIQFPARIELSQPTGDKN